MWWITQLYVQVAVEYGADLLSSDLDSGFPTHHNAKTDIAKEYADDPWNLTHFADLEDSVLKYITEPISGVKIPWVYVGMVFSSFCWHVEDHWTYSINYQHWLVVLYTLLYWIGRSHPLLLLIIMTPLSYLVIPISWLYVWVNLHVTFD